MPSAADRPGLPTRRTAVLGAAVLGLTACASGNSSSAGNSASSGTAPASASSAASPSGSATASASASAAAGRNLDTTTPSSPTVLVNKHHPLSPLDWAPTDLVAFGSVQLRREAADAATEMFAAASRAGVVLTAISGYRSHATQVATYQQWVSSYGKDRADVASARPGYSEHQSGLAMDLGGDGSCDLKPCFKDSPAAQWAAAHASEHGFVLRFPWMQQDVTGYWYESWHLRYLGREVAARYRASGARTYEEFVGSEAAPTYRDQS